MSDKTTPAFPRPGANFLSANGSEMGNDAQLGMSLRDYFAAQTIPTMTLSNVDLASEAQLAQALETAAKVCYGMADAMLKARQS